MNIKEQIQLLSRGCADILPENGLEEKLLLSEKEKRPLRVKLGIDASGPDIHLGFSIPLRKLAQFQKLGHQAVLIFGDFTGKIGDPTGKNKTRPQLTNEMIQENLKNYKKQVFKILDPEKTEIRFNGEWLDKLTPYEIVGLTSKFTVARMLERDYFHKRYTEGEAISIHEFLYPLFQAYDSVAIKADIELGGTDQTFNLLLGRIIQEEYGVVPQLSMTMPLLEGLDGTRKMSKSYGNYIGIMEAPKEIFGKTMSIPDELILKYFTLTTDIEQKALDEMKKRLDGGENPRNLKVELAKTLIEMYHDRESAVQAEEEFNRIFKKGGYPDDMPEQKIEIKEYEILELLKILKMTSSNSESRRLIDQGGVKINGEKIENVFAKVTPSKDDVLQVGKKKFIKIK